jgi:D-tagatose-1,6-bisphosphate aldolase subunit GatZ/KbaZ
MVDVQNKLIGLVERHKSGGAVGIPSLCTANWSVIKSAIRHAGNYEKPVLIEATSNQVNQFGGYTGYVPEAFRDEVFTIAKALNYPVEKIILGGDHLGPNAWQDKNAETALGYARTMIEEYVNAGFSKIHLDASMKCADDGNPNEPLSPAIIAERTALLCQAAEAVYINCGKRLDPPVYIIGTDVPVPGGMKAEHGSLRITRANEVEETVALTQKAFYKYNLYDAWSRVIGIVVQPGVEFGDTVVLEYEPDKAKELVKKIESFDSLVYEAHSTDYQRREILKRMVQDHFAILKVGPWLTYAFREAVYALAYIEKELLSDKPEMAASGILAAIDRAMMQNPLYWQKYYFGSSKEIQLAMKYSYSDRVRYYWTDNQIESALHTLLQNLKATQIPATLLSQFMPDAYQAVRNGEAANTPDSLIHYKIQQVLEIYHYAATEVNT